jgi:protein Mpv17
MLRYSSRFSVAWAVAATLLLTHTSDGFSVPDTFHLVQTAAATLSHQTTHAGEQLLTAYKHQLAQHPLPTKMMTGATLAVCGDAIAQSKNTDSDPQYDVTRASSFAVFDSAYRALQHYAFPILVTQCQGHVLGGVAAVLLAQSAASHDGVAHAAAAMEQTLASQWIIVPLLYYPAFFALTGTMQGLDAEACVQRARDTVVPLLLRNWLFWIPVQFVQFCYVPTEYQIPFLSCAGLAWTCILSMAAGSAKPYANTNKNDPAEKMMAVVATTSDRSADTMLAVVVDGVTDLSESTPSSSMTGRAKLVEA